MAKLPAAQRNAQAAERHREAGRHPAVGEQRATKHEREAAEHRAEALRQQGRGSFMAAADESYRALLHQAAAATLRTAGAATGDGRRELPAGAER